MVRVVPYQLPNKLLHIYILRICSVLLITDHILFILYSTQLSNHIGNYKVKYLQQLFSRSHCHLTFRWRTMEKRSLIVDAARMIAIIRITYPDSVSRGLNVSPPNVSLSGLRQIIIMLNRAFSPHSLSFRAWLKKLRASVGMFWYLYKYIFTISMRHAWRSE